MSPAELNQHVTDDSRPLRGNSPIRLPVHGTDDEPHFDHDGPCRNAGSAIAIVPGLRQLHAASSLYLRLSPMLGRYDHAAYGT